MRLQAPGMPTWHRARSATTTVFAHQSGVAVQIQKPPFRCVLEAGEFYTVPPGVDMAVFAVGREPVSFTVFEYGEAFDVVECAPPTLAHVGERTRSPADDPTEDAPALPYDDLTTGLSRMDVLASPFRLRLIVQGHGRGQCVPWHSHDEITDYFFCTHGRARIATRDSKVHLLATGETCEVPPGMPHFVSGEAGMACEMLVLQGVGHYNYVAR